MTKLADNHLLFVNFHHVRPRNPPEFGGLHHLSDSQFATQLEVLGRHFDFPEPDGVREALLGCRTLGAPSVVLTFDDGLKDHYQFVLPTLERFGIKAVFSICTSPWETDRLLSVHMAHLLSAAFSYLELAKDFDAAAAQHGVRTRIEDLDLALGRTQYRYDDPETARVKYFLNACLPQAIRPRVLETVFRRRLREPRGYRALHYMAPDEVRALVRAGHALALHSHCHLHLASASPEERRMDLASNLRALQANVIGSGTAIRWISYPYGSPTSYDEHVIRDARDIGCEVGITMRRGLNRVGEGADPMRLARVDTNDAVGGKRPLTWEQLIDG